ncbi:RES family NAD+ phosphorylase [Waterburya agarophytonicola K14]|uniref:RES family NAD+ phosphorylase n=1 Tax=Waterburya agarophytonicola KI4 TaxID=2874699 RepID=A0A964FGV3_9CYAN|nr:RES family NAD+ phosphorylase [Waterburya agarophytonicola]MCC0179365.1 RES family NAD+ phosphorylase [Waterburya agarophytonicola KI4]
MTNQTNDNQDKPGLHPPPPLDLDRRELPLKSFAAATIFYRVHKSKNDPIYFNNSGGGRLDTSEGVLYLGIDEYVAFRETIGRFNKYRLISSEELEKRRMTEVKSSHALSLVDLTAEGLTLLDADNRLFTGNYKIAQQWSKAIQDHPSKPDGIYYRSRHDPSRFCIALYHQVQIDSPLQVVKTNNFFSTQYSNKLDNILNKYRYGLNMI